jgi:hypothetical protein
MATSRLKRRMFDTKRYTENSTPTMSCPDPRPQIASHLGSPRNASQRNSRSDEDCGNCGEVTGGGVIVEAAVVLLPFLNNACTMLV